MSNGMLISGTFDEEAPENESEEQSESKLRANIGKSLFGFTIPALWQVSGTYAFAIDSGHCERQCRDNKFSAPPGLDLLDGSDFGGITKEDLITGSVRTWLQNGKTNGGGFADPTDGGTIDNLLNVDVTTPSYMRLPVCRPERAL
ncbi:hypothetical protein BJ166DRAFT_492378 [Pestalotiopsis sp. NC0098]|nr:hypothetical protein BJ166DRAFT_492378 [Pestalotiopsis sp. NC0098]